VRPCRLGFLQSISPNERNVCLNASPVIIELFPESRGQQPVFDPNPDLGPNHRRQRREKYER
jgi:hypothetical protein